MDEFKIESGIPIPGPARKKTHGICHALRAMGVGDSFTVNNGKYRSIHAMAGQTGIKVTVRKQENGTIRVWRIA